METTPQEVPEAVSPASPAPPGFAEQLAAALEEMELLRESRGRAAAIVAGADDVPVARDVFERAMSSDPRVALCALRELRPVLRRLEREAVARGRERGMRWSEIARVLGRSRQSVHRSHA